MAESDIFIKIILSIVFGALIGLETETRAVETKGKKVAAKEARERIGGVRTFTVISLFGGIAGLLYLQQAYILVYIMLISIITFTIVAYILNVQLKKAFGITTELAIIITFILGFVTTSALISLVTSFIILILLTFFLSQKRGLGALIMKIEHKEVIDIMKFALVSVVILPLLPDKNISIGDLLAIFGVEPSSTGAYGGVTLINPFQVWFIVVVISGVNLLGYGLSRAIGKNKGLFFAGIFGGLVSSTSTLISLAPRSKENDKNSVMLAGITLVANGVSFLPSILILFISSKKLFEELAPVFILLLLGSLAIGGLFMFLSKRETIKSGKELGLKYKPFSIKPALKFVMIILFIKLFVQILQLRQVDTSFLISVTSLSGITGIDAAVIAFADLVTGGAINVTTGVLAFLLLNNVNFIAKGVYGYFTGSLRFFTYLSFGLLLTAVIGFLGLVL